MAMPSTPFKTTKNSFGAADQIILTGVAGGISLRLLPVEGHTIAGSITGPQP